MVEVPHFASLRDGEREISILRSEDGESWRAHVQAASDSRHDVQDAIRATTGGSVTHLTVHNHITLHVTLPTPER